MKKSLLLIAACALMLASACERDCSIKYEVEKTPVMGMSFWNAFQLNINEALVMDQALAITELGLDKVGYKYVNIDDGFQLPRDSAGHFMYNAELFPNGMKYVADYIHSLGLKAGIYTDAGDNTCGSENKYPYGLGTGLVGHEEEDCRLFFDDWGYDFIKIDYCGGQHAGLDEKEQYTKIANAIRSCDKKDITFNVCRWRYPGTWIEDIADSWRTTYDIRPWFSQVKYIIDENLWLQAYTRNGHYNDCDMLEIGSKWPGSDAHLSHDEELTHMAYWCIASSPLVMGCDMRKVPKESLEVMMNADLIAMNQNPLGLGAPVVQRSGEVYVVAKDMDAIMGPKRAVLVMNLSDVEQTIDVSAEALGFKGEIKFYDCFTHQDRPDLTCETSFSQTLAPHASAAYFVTGKRIEKTVYQAEESYLNNFNTIDDEPETQYRPSESADMGVYASGLGGNADNWLEWYNVFSCKGGEYVATIRYASDKSSAFTVNVNGKEVETFSELSTGAADGNWDSVNVKIKLDKGLNAVRLTNPEGPMPNIDCMTLHRQ